MSLTIRIMTAFPEPCFLTVTFTSAQTKKPLSNSMKKNYTEVVETLAPACWW